MSLFKRGREKKGSKSEPSKDDIFALCRTFQLVLDNSSKKSAIQADLSLSFDGDKANLAEALSRVANIAAVKESSKIKDSDVNYLKENIEALRKMPELYELDVNIKKQYNNLCEALSFKLNPEGSQAQNKFSGPEGP